MTRAEFMREYWRLARIHDVEALLASIMDDATLPLRNPTSLA